MSLLKLCLSMGVVCLTCLLFLPAAHAEPTENPAQVALSKGVKAFRSGDYETAEVYFLISAEMGYRAAQYNMGVLYENGFGRSKDQAEATRWFRMSAENGYPRAMEKLTEITQSTQDYEAAGLWFRAISENGFAMAQAMLAVMIDEGMVTPEYPSEMEHWYRKAAEQDVPHAQFNLGVNLRTGKIGGDPDGEEAVYWLEKAANQGLAEAQYALAEMYDWGMGVPADRVKAMQWFLKAAEQGFEHAQLSAGLAYAMGYGGPQDVMAAHLWLSRAAGQGLAEAQEKLALLESKLPPAILKKARNATRQAMTN